ncbi:MAG: hypothetical protein F6K31_28415 [Symploca sp. SIO2G7]|nr:hypothetical protein [Symploca sp. SIO2G7]
MAKITDPDFLVRDTELVFNFTTPTARTIQLVKTGNLSDDGVALQAIYSKCKELWKNEADLIRIPFPFDPITPTQFDLINDWNWADATTRQVIRDGGWAVRDSGGNSLEEWACIISLGSLSATTDQIYYQQQANGAAQNFVLPDAVNQAVQIYKSGAGAFDYRGFLKLFCREQGKTYTQSSLADIGVTTMTYKDYGFPISNSQDLKISASDNDISTTVPYTGMSITYQAAPVVRDIGGANYNFDVIIEGNGATVENIYEFVQYQLRQNSDIDAGAGVVTGQTADSLLRFLGDTLITSESVFIDNFSATDTNSIDFYDNTNTVRRFPYVAAGEILFNSNLQTDTDAVFSLFFADNYGTASGIIVNDADGSPISGSVNGVGSLSFTFDYDGNNQGGRTPATDVSIVAVAIGLDKAQFVSATATITRSVSNVVNLVSNLERNYQNS